MAFSSIASLAGSAISTITEWAGSAVVGEFISTGFSYLRDRGLPADSEAELKRLQAALPQIKAVMGIAEALKVKDPNTSEWVEQFRQAVEASEDVLDELEYKKLEDMVKNRDEAGGSTSSSKKRKVSALNDDTLERLKKALTMLDRAAAETERLVRHAKRLGIHGLSESQQETGKALRPETTSFLTEMKVFGRKVEKEKIIGWLKRPTDARLSSFGIVGVGGLGKTTLAQFAYQKMHGSNHFDKTIWVCVSTNFSVEDITRKLLGELGESSCSGKPLNALQETLKEKIHLKKLLIILDDLWDDEKMSDWEKLVAPLRFVQQGSKILFTTRMKSVADLLERVIHTEHEYLTLQGLREQELRLLFQNYAFHRFNLDNHRDLQEIGDRILKMLRGSPLAAKVIGSLLNSHMDHQYWRRILNHGSLFNLEQAKDVVEVLKLSYYHLPANLQVCFRFCSIFAQDHQFDKDELIRMWICSGFIPQQLCQEERLEDIGEDYFNHLLRKSFFEYSQSYNGKTRYTMHDLMHDLAQNVSYGECCRIESNYKGSTIPSTVRHVYVHGSKIDRVSHLENLHSLVIYHCSNMSSLNNLMKKPLRLLKINVYNCTFEMPEEISCLVHLRYLSIDLITYMSHEPFQYSVLGSIYKLYHLQVLEFAANSYNTYYPRIETTGITNLLRLRYMRLPNNTIETIREIHKLTSLQELTFFIGKEIGYRINELRTLSILRHLSIENIENIGDHTEAKTANLLGKNNLMSLSLKWTSKSNPIHPEKIIDYLQPPPSLMELTINNYNGQRAPNWMVDSPSLNLSSLKLLNCTLWKNQLFSGKIPCLKILNIRDCPNLDKLPDMPLSLIEFRISNVGLTSLPTLYQNSGNNTHAPLSLKSSLRVVEIESCPNLISLDGFLEQGNLDLQVIKELTIKDCERLVHLLIHGFGKLTSLTDLTLRDCLMLTTIDNQSTLLPMALKYLTIENCGKVDEPLLESASSLPTLTKIHISDCANISHIPSSENAFGSLNVLSIMGCKKLLEHSSREQAHGANQGSSLASLKIKNLSIDKLSLLLIEPLRSLRFVSFLLVHDCSGMEALPEQWLLQNSSTLTELNLWDVRTLNSLSSIMARLTVLEKLVIRKADLLEELRELPASLRSLEIWNARSLKSLPATMARLTVLKNLEIWDADLLEELPELPASLRSLVISNARSLKSLPATMARLTVLQNLQIRGADLVEELPELPVSLRSLVIPNAISLNSLSSIMAKLTVLEMLIISEADLLEELPELPASLKSLEIRNASSLKSLPATIARLTVL